MFETIGTVVPSGASVGFLKKLPRLPQRSEQGHKGTYGQLLVIGGSVGMSGAVCLAGGGALVAGAGLVRLAVPSPIMPTVASFAPEYMTLALPATEDGGLSENGVPNLLAALGGTGAIAIGPGLGRLSETGYFVRHILRQVALPMVVDADALFALSKQRAGTRGKARIGDRGARIFTPHPGEFARLTEREIPDAEPARIEAAREFVRTCRGRFTIDPEQPFILILKGHRTVITDGENVYVNETGNAGLATGGTGDVLTGLLGALLAQQIEAMAASRLAVALHGLAAECAATCLPLESITASDVIRYFPSALNYLRKVQDE
ncbi:MAG: NAD(P)H-hydrate dehydratase [Planctomycetia bacterium]|nr:NAD(P)H-hydrate dehydratase [Planctomycetia bacterium]